MDIGTGFLSGLHTLPDTDDTKSQCISLGVYCNVLTIATVNPIVLISLLYIVE